MFSNNTLSNGITLYQQGRYGDALKIFEQASSQQNVKRVARADADKNLDSLIDALKDSQQTLNLAPVAFRGDGHSEPSPSHGDKLRASLKIADFALGRMQTSDTKRRAELQALREEIWGELRTLSIFDILPVEAQIHIFGFAVRRGDPGVLTLILVCRTWKELVIETPSLWRHFELGHSSTQEVADARLKRAGDTFTSLRIEGGTWARRVPNVFKNASKEFWSGIEELELGGDGLVGVLPAGAIPQLRLRRLIVNCDGLFGTPTLEGANKLDTSGVRDLSILAKGILKLDFKIDLQDLPFSRLTTLELYGPYRSEPFFELLRQNPTLETLILDQSTRPGGFSEASEPIHLPLLRRVELSGSGPFDVILRCVMMPNLSILQLGCLYESSPTPGIKEILSQGIFGIHQLYLNSSSVTLPSLRSLLQNSACLSHLTLSDPFSSYKDKVRIDSVAKALCEPASEPGEDGPPSSILCPKLQYLSFPRARHLNIEQLISLVKIRRCENPTVGPKGETPFTSVQPDHPQNQPLPILYLNIVDCKNISPVDRQWFRDAVPRVSLPGQKS